MLDPTQVVAMSLGEAKVGAVMPLNVTRLPLAAWVWPAKSALVHPSVVPKGNKGAPPVICIQRRRVKAGEEDMGDIQTAEEESSEFVPQT